MTQNTTGADGTYTTNGTPHGSTALTPHLVVNPAAEAIAFYRDVFGARVVDVTEMGGIVAHAVLDFGNGMLTLGDPMPELGLIPLDPAAGHQYSMALYCPDVDAVTARAQAAGATVREASATFVSGDRYASLLDPFGVRWTIMTRVDDLSPEESAARVAEWAAAQG
ncbi:VOC family protein [Microbacterium sp. STN6]|uniref:VOC family protein n=1 Tax=Microbacterium sp. STN6 TaxID=2995588 RepID=UPI002260CBFE|nr:VOC family protein [Microbacterium sp. STN6]MCX7521108.1 VOC family protein [Microbacterium sp. STN6]